MCRIVSQYYNLFTVVQVDKLTGWYRRNFKELSEIAGGAFGTVFRTRHKLDGVEYAVKKVNIELPTIDSMKRYLKEVKILARLKHPNIVPYNTAWLEYTEESDAEESDRSYTSDVEKSGSDYILFQTPSNESSKNNNVLNNQYGNSLGANGNMLSLCTDNSKESSLNKNIIEGINYHNDKEIDNGSMQLNSVTLYIQMELCQCTLRQWLDERDDNLTWEKSQFLFVDQQQQNACSFTVKVDIFTQIVKGLQYLHSKDIRHHDLNPVNIFVSGDPHRLSVQLGDFGIACLSEQSHKYRGTPPYIAPEIWKGQCTLMSDMYSIGFILFEIVEHFSSDEDREEAIEKLEQGRISFQLIKKYPEIVHIIQNLIQNEPRKRLDTFKLLEKLQRLKSHEEK